MFSIEIPCCDLSKIFDGPQAYRWRRVNDNKYVVVDGKKIVLVEQKKNRKIFVCSEDDFFNYWFKYFDCDFDYGKTLFTIKEFYKEIKKSCFFFSFMIKENRRYRMVKNDLFETMIYYAIDENNRNQKFERFLHTFGTKKNNSLGGLKITWFKFPDPDKIDLTYNCGLTRDEKRKLSNILNEINDNILEKLRMSQYEDDVYTILQNINDDNEWIKNVMLYSLGFKNMFCIDSKMKDLMKINGIKPAIFTKFDNVKGFLLQLMRTKQNGNN